MSKFKKGQSGNPSGRPPGSGIAGKLRKAIEAESGEILQSLITQAKGGDTVACKLLLDRIFPPLKPHATPISIQEGESLPATGNNVISATLDGTISPDIGSQLIRALTDQGKLIELEDISKRLGRIEKQLEARK